MATFAKGLITKILVRLLVHKVVERVWELGTVWTIKPRMGVRLNIRGRMDVCDGGELYTSRLYVRIRVHASI